MSWLRVPIYAALLVGVYYSALQKMITQWGHEDYNYCYLIPFLVLYLLWEKKGWFFSLPSVSTWWGLLPFGTGLLLCWVGELSGQYYTLYVSFWLAIVGLAMFHLGWEKLKVIWFPVIMMLAMFPFPDIVNMRLSFGLKLISSQIGVFVLQLVGMAAYREGNVIDLGFTQLQVVDACSGLRYLFPLMILALLLAYWFRPVSHVPGGQREQSSIIHRVFRHWKRLVLFLSSIPIAIVVNALRIAITGMLYPFMGAAAAEGFFHDFSGWLIFMFTIPVLLAEMWILRRIGKKKVRKT
jgi:exosortase